MKQGLCLLLAVAWMTTGWAATETYGYPITDRWQATVIGTPEQFKADLPDTIPKKKRRITIFEDREVPEPLWFDKPVSTWSLFHRPPI
jgi:hypothetical protein